MLGRKLVMESVFIFDGLYLYSICISLYMYTRICAWMNGCFS